MTLRVARQQAPGGGQRAMIANGGEHVAQFALLRNRVTNSVGRQQRQLQRTGDFDGGPVTHFLLAMKVPLQLYINIAAAENTGQAFDRPPRLVHTALRQRSRQWAVISAGEADQAVGVFLQLVCANMPFAFFRAQLHPGNEVAKILIAGAR